MLEKVFPNDTWSAGVCVYSEIQGSRDKPAERLSLEGWRSTSLELEERERFRFYSLSPQEKEGLLEKLREELSRHEEIKLAVVFGSFLKDYPFRDIDVAVYVVGGADPLDYKLGLEEELERKIGYPIDIAVLNEAPPWFVRKVLREGRALFTRHPLLLERLYLKAIDEEQHFKNLNRLGVRGERDI